MDLGGREGDTIKVCLLLLYSNSADELHYSVTPSTAAHFASVSLSHYNNTILTRRRMSGPSPPCTSTTSRPRTAIRHPQTPQRHTHIPLRQPCYSLVTPLWHLRNTLASFTAALARALRRAHRQEHRARAESRVGGLPAAARLRGQRDVRRTDWQLLCGRGRHGLRTLPHHPHRRHAQRGIPAAQHHAAWRPSTAHQISCSNLCPAHQPVKCIL